MPKIVVTPSPDLFCESSCIKCGEQPTSIIFLECEITRFLREGNALPLKGPASELRCELRPL